MRKIRLSFKHEIRKLSKIQREIFRELSFHVAKVYNMLLYDVIEGKEYIPEKGNINVISSSIYRKYRKENWHSKYMHS